MNGFQLHKLKHTSVSSANKWRDCPSAWACDKLGKAKFPTGWAAIQGFSVESGVEHGVINDADTKDCVRIAIDQFKKQSMLMKNLTEEREKRIPIITRMVETALEQLKPLGKPEVPPPGKRQHEINIPIRFADGDDGTINCLGYLDFYYPDPNLIVDLKTTKNAPRGWSLSHGIQASVYQRAIKSATGSMPQVKFLYCLTRQKDPYVWLEMENPTEYLASFKQTIIQLEKFLRLSSDPKVLIDALPYNPDSFYWNDAQEIATKFYG